MATPGINKLFKQTIKELVKPSFISQGYSANANTFKQQKDGFVKVCTVHKDGGLPNSMSVVFEIGCYIPYEHILFWGDDTVFAKIQTYHCGRYRKRIYLQKMGGVKSNGTWFFLREKTKLKDIQPFITQSIEKSLNSLSKINTIYDLLNTRELKKSFNCHPPKFQLGLTLIKLGNRELGMKLYKEGFHEFIEFLRTRAANEFKYIISIDEEIDSSKNLWKKFKEIASELHIPIDCEYFI